MTAEPRDVEEIRADMPLRPEDIADRLAAADRENAELRAAILRNVDTHADLSTQLAAAQAQLAEATDNGRWIKPARAASYYDAIVRRAVTWPGWEPFYTAGGAPDDDAMVAFLAAEHERAEAAEARLEAALLEVAERAAEHYAVWRYRDSADDEDAGEVAVCAACSPKHTPEGAWILWPCDWLTDLRDVEKDLMLGTAALSAAPQPEPVDAIEARFQQARREANERHDTEPPASDEPARCEHGRTAAHYINPDFIGPYALAANLCPGPAASGTPDGGQ